MAKQYGKAALQLLKGFRSTKWFTKDFISLASKISKEYSARSEVMWGCACTKGAKIDSDEIDITHAAGQIMLGGKVYSLSGATTDLAAAAANLIFTDGSAADQETFSGDSYGAVIACNSDGADDVAAEGSAVVLVGVVNGTTGSYGSTPPSSAQITAALAAAATPHNGITGWVHLATFKNTANNSTSTVTSNLNNHLGL